jgi:hypothetical protein
VTDEELARKVNEKTRDWVLKPSFRVTRNRPTQVPVAQVTADTRPCEATWRTMREYGKALGGDFGSALEQQVKLAKGESPALPIAARRFYVASSEPSALRAAASTRGLPRFPGTVEQARTLAKLVTFTRIVELDYQAPNLSVRDLGVDGDPGDLIPVDGSYAGFVAALPACGRVYDVDATAGLLFLRFPDAVPTQVVRAREASVSLRTGQSIPCSDRSSDVVGTCFRVPFDPKLRVYKSDSVECVQPVGGQP